MSSTGLVFCVIVISITLFLPQSLMALLPPTIFVGIFLAVERRKETLKAISYGFVIIFPILLYLSIVWILIVGAAPGSNSRQSAFLYVMTLCSKLFLFVVFLQSTLGSRLAIGAMRFLSEVRLPKGIKIISAMTLSMASTIRASAEKAWISLVANNLLSPRIAWKNLRNFIRFILAIWMSIVGTVAMRLQTKWALEDVRQRLGDHFSSAHERSFTRRDFLWAGHALLTMGLTIAFKLR